MHMVDSKILELEMNFGPGSKVVFHVAYLTFNPVPNPNLVCLKGPMLHTIVPPVNASSTYGKAFMPQSPGNMALMGSYAIGVMPNPNLIPKLNPNWSYDVGAMRLRQTRVSEESEGARLLPN